MLSLLAACVAASSAMPVDDAFPLEFRPDKVFEAIPGSMLMNVQHMTQERPASVKREPAYKNKPWYASLTFGESGPPIAMALDEDDEAALLYVDINGNGDLTDDPKPGDERQVTPEEKRTPQLKVWIYDLFTVSVPAAYQDGSHRELPITIRTYGKVCRDLYDHMKPDIVYWNAYYRVGPVKFGDQEYTVAVKDQNTDGRFDTIKDAAHPRGDMVYIDTNRDGKFETRTEGVALGNPIEVDKVVYEVARIAPAGDRISFARTQREVPRTTLQVGQLAPDFDLPSGGKLSSLRDKVVLVDFWATWCAPCLAEMPHVVKVHEQFKDRGFTVIGVSIDKEADAAKMRRVAGDKGMAWPCILDAGQKTAHDYFVTSIPATFLIGPDGKVLAAYLRGDELSKAVERAVGDLPAGAK